MQTQQAAETLEHAERLRHETRATLSAFSFTFLAFGALSLGSAPVAAVAGGGALAIYWALAAPLGILAGERHSRRRERERGLEGWTIPYLATGALIALGCFAAAVLAGALASETAAVAAPTLVVAAGILILAWLDRSPPVAVFAAALAALAAALAVGGLGAEVTATTLALATGLGLLGAGAAYRRREGRRT